MGIEDLPHKQPPHDSTGNSTEEATNDLGLDSATSHATSESQRVQATRFACERDAFWNTSTAGMLGSFDGRDARDLHVYAVAAGDEQLLVSVHEQLHHELQWSTGWGLIAAMAGLLAGSGTRTPQLQSVADYANRRARQVHEVFATTVSSGVLGVDRARALLAGNRRYTNYLEYGLNLGGDDTSWPWQFRESAIQMLLRTLMNPNELHAVAAVGFDHLTVDHLHPIRPPDTRLQLAHNAGTWWTPTFADLHRMDPARGGDTGDLWTRGLPTDDLDVEQLRAYEETVLIPHLAATARTELEAVGLSCLNQEEYLDVASTLQQSFSALAPSTWQVELLTERRPASQEPLGAERERIQLYPHRASARVVARNDIVDTTFVIRQHGGSPVVLITYLTGRTHANQFGLEELAAVPAVLGIAGWPTWLNEDAREVPLALIAPPGTPRQLIESVTSLPTCLLTSLSVTRDNDLRAHVLDAPFALVLVDLPLSMQVKWWVDDGWTARFAAIELRGAFGLTLFLFQLDGLPNLLFLSYRTTAGFGELAQLLDRHPNQLLTGLAPNKETMNAVTAATAWILASWWRIQEAENL